MMRSGPAHFGMGPVSDGSFLRRNESFRYGAYYGKIHVQF